MNLNKKFLDNQFIKNKKYKKLNVYGNIYKN